MPTTYRTATNIKVLSTGLVRRKGQAIGVGDAPPALWQRWLAEGVVIEVGDSLDTLRQRAKDAGIDYYWSKNAATLREELDDAAQD